MGYNLQQPQQIVLVSRIPNPTITAPGGTAGESQRGNTPTNLASQMTISPVTEDTPVVNPP